MRPLFTFLLVVILLGATGAPGAQELKDTLFAAATQAKEAAEDADAEALSPRNYERGLEEYQSAESAFERGRNIDTIRSRLARATDAFNEATEQAGLARLSLAAVIKTRQDARAADAPSLSKPIWDDAERRFADAVLELERGDLRDSDRRAREAESLYRDAELGAIKTRYLSETRNLLTEAERGRVGRVAPITLDRARQFLQRAEKELNENRYDTDLPRSLAQQANYEARHAIHLAEVIRNVNDDRTTVEQLILRMEQPLIEIAGAADIVPNLATGTDELTAELVAHVQDLTTRNQALEQDLADASARVAEMDEEIRLLDERLGGATAERTALMQRLQRQARVREQFEQIEQMFTRDEALVFREGNDITMRLVGLSFPSGSAQVESSYYPFLEKVERAIDVFPRSALVVEGHTDSYGSDETNLKLSQARAEAVMTYMVNAMRIPTNRLTAVGYGETRPVANNETAEGRARNRRIDIVIRPRID